jgi:hypothetical protein
MLYIIDKLSLTVFLHNVIDNDVDYLKENAGHDVNDMLTIMSLTC